MATDKKGNGTGRPGQRRGGIDEDGIYRRRSLVTIERDAFQGDLYDRKAMEEIQANRPGYLGRSRKDLLEYHFVITTRRYGSGGEWEVEIHFPDGEDRTLPEEVLDAINRQRKSIIEAQRKDNAAGRQPPVKKSFDDLDAEDQDESMEAAEVPPSLQPYFEAEERRQNRG